MKLVIVLGLFALLVYVLRNGRWGYSPVDDMLMGPHYYWFYLGRLRLFVGKWAFIVNWVNPKEHMYRNLIYWERKEGL